MDSQRKTNAERDRVSAVEDIDGAIKVVVAGVARRVQLYGFPDAEAAAPLGAAHAQMAGVAFRVERDGAGTITLVIGPVRHA